MDIETLGREVTCPACGELGVVVMMRRDESTVRHWRIVMRPFEDFTGSVFDVPRKETYEHVVVESGRAQ